MLFAEKSLGERRDEGGDRGGETRDKDKGREGGGHSSCLVFLKTKRGTGWQGTGV